jgi:hypothetical protein
LGAAAGLKLLTGVAPCLRARSRGVRFALVVQVLQIGGVMKAPCEPPKMLTLMSSRLPAHQEPGPYIGPGSWHSVAVRRFASRWRLMLLIPLSRSSFRRQLA